MIGTIVLVTVSVLAPPPLSKTEAWEQGGGILVIIYNKNLELCEMSQNLNFDKYFGLFAWCQENMHGTRWLWWSMSLAPLLVMVIANTNFIIYFEKEKFVKIIYGEDKTRTYINQHV